MLSDTDPVTVTTEQGVHLDTCGLCATVVSLSLKDACAIACAARACSVTGQNLPPFNSVVYIYPAVARSPILTSLRHCFFNASFDLV